MLHDIWNHRRALHLSRMIFLGIKPLESCWWCGSGWYKQFKIAKLTLCFSQQFQWLTVLSPMQFTDDNSKRKSLFQFAAPTAVICFCLDIHNSRNTTKLETYFSYCFQFQCQFLSSSSSSSQKVYFPCKILQLWLVWV